MKKQIVTGCSSYATESWKSLFYPENLPKSKWFDYYCEHFNTYEFNGSFYRFPSVGNLLTWHDKTPAHFEFSIKVPKTITHIRKLNGCDDEIRDFYAVCADGLQSKLACILWQLPPSFSFTTERLHQLTALLNPDFRNTVEFRHESWWNPAVTKAFEHNNIIFCNPSYPRLPHTTEVTSRIGYFRLHGIPELFYSEYSKDELAGLCRAILNAPYEKVYVYFNNTASVAAIKNALVFQDMLKDEATA